MFLIANERGLRTAALSCLWSTVSPSARCLSVCLSASWGSVPVKAEPCSHTAWAGHPTLNYLNARICINAHKHTHTDTHMPRPTQVHSLGRAIGWGGCESAPLLALHSMSSSQKVVFLLFSILLFIDLNLALHLLSFRHSEVYTVSPAREYMQILPKPGARWCKVRKCQLFLSVKCDRTTVLINREADTQQINESMNGFWLICNYWFFRLLNRRSLPLPLYFCLSSLTVAGCVLNATVSIIFSCTKNTLQVVLTLMFPLRNILRGIAFLT